MAISFIRENTDTKNLNKIEESEINPILAENNKKQLEKIFEFYQGNKPLLLVSGFMGTGKTQVVNHSFNFLNENAIVLRYNCFETTILDDIFLSFFEDFKELTAQGKITEPKLKSENFAQKISSYFNTISQPIVIVINSFESILKTNKQEILDFLFHINQKPNIKTIIITRTVNYEDFTGKTDFDKVIIQALEKNLFEKYLRSVGIKTIGPISDELYKHSRGYFLYTELTAKIINTHKLALIDFIEGYTKSFLTYNDFILREALALVDPTSGHLFRLLTVMRHPVSTNLLETINLYDEEKINYFVDNLLLCREKNMIYLQDYYKEISQNSIPENVSIKLHHSCIDLYSTQLPLKPFERDLLISRQTMRSEIEYHTLFIPKKPQQVKPMETMRVEAIGYSADTKANYETIPKGETSTPQPDIKVEKPESKEEKLRKISFIFETETEEKQIMEDIASSINSYIDYSNKVLTAEESRLPFMELINAANREEKSYNHKKALAFYQLALTMKDDENYALVVSRIYTKIARCYENLSDWFNALKYYDMALEYFVNAGDVDKLNEMRYFIANVFYNTYKHGKAEQILNEILKPESNASGDLKIKTYMLLALIKTDNLQASYEIYKKAFALIEATTSKKILAELYYKFATICDDLDEIENAVKLYKHCIDISSDNPNLASAMLNLATIFEDTGKDDLAVRYYKESIATDEENKNLSGIYEASLRLAKMLKRKNPDEAINYFKKTITTAREINEPYYTVNSNLEFGDFYADRKDFSKALKAYIIASTKIKDKTSEQYKIKIEQRIKDLKIRLGEEEFKKLENEIIKNG